MSNIGSEAVVDAATSGDSFFASMRTLKALLHSPDKRAAAARSSSSSGETTALSEACKVLQSKLAEARAGQQEAAEELEREKARRESVEKIHADTAKDLQGKLQEVQEALRQEMSKRLTLEKAHHVRMAAETEQQAVVKEIRAQLDETTKEWQAKLESAKEASEKEKALRLAKEKELEELRLTKDKELEELRAKMEPAATPTQQETTGTPKGKMKKEVESSGLLGTPTRKIKMEGGVAVPASPLNVPLLQDKITRLSREKEELRLGKEEDHKKHLQEMDRLLQQKQSAVSQRDSMAAKLSGSQKVLEELRAQLEAAQQQQQQDQQPGSNNDAGNEGVEEKHEEDLKALEQKYQAIVDNLNKEVSLLPLTVNSVCMYAIILSVSEPLSVLLFGSEQLAEARAAARSKGEDEEEEEASDTDVESLRQMVDILAGDVNVSKQQLESTKRVYEDVKKSMDSASAAGAVSGAESNKGDSDDAVEKGSLRQTIQRLGSELEAALQQNAELSKWGASTEEKLAWTEEQLENAVDELTRSRAREQGRSLLAGYKRERESEREDADDESTETDDEVDRSDSSSSDGEDQRERRSDDGDSDEGEAVEPEVIELDDDGGDDEPTPKKQKPATDDE